MGRGSVVAPDTRCQSTPAAVEEEEDNGVKSREWAVRGL